MRISEILPAAADNNVQVKKVYLLVRSKKGKTAAERVEALLCGPLFNLLHKHAAVDGGSCLAKVQAVDGDLLQPGLGLSSADAAMLEQQVCFLAGAG
jgi:thioester reductase-like protein